MRAKGTRRIHFKRNDVVVAIAGKDKGKSGKVLQILPTRYRVIVEGLQFVKKHARPTQDSPQGGIVQKEASMHISNLLLQCSNCNKPVRVSYVFLEDGAKSRVCRKCKEQI